ncbi:toxin YdaT family protein [Acerihabitans sp. KWT182]|uniref:Toxin YdaT family protein n=1 Tax=Acerihabitans sp. KWT182 TaxID=3157919 RepID=A0AAU7QAC7_9GAMM
MENIEKLKHEIMSWAAERGQEHVAIEISRAWRQQLSTNPTKIYLHPIEDELGQADWQAINNNRQQIFRWLRGESKAARTKVHELTNAMIAALPAERRARIDGEPFNYLIAVLVRNMSSAIIAALLTDRDMSHHIKAAHNALDALLCMKVSR